LRGKHFLLKGIRSLIKVIRFFIEGHLGARGCFPVPPRPLAELRRSHRLGVGKKSGGHLPQPCVASCISVPTKNIGTFII